jgi:hypothetical protein
MPRAARRFAETGRNKIVLLNESLSTWRQLFVGIVVLARFPRRELVSWGCAWPKESHAHLRERGAGYLVSVAAVFAAVSAVVPPVLTPVSATVNPVGDDHGPADCGGSPAPASCCQWHVRLLP